MPEAFMAIDHWLPLAVGIVLLAFGRRLFWLLLGTLGFLFAFNLVSRLAADTSPPALLWLLAGAVGVAGAVAAIFLQKVAIGIAGFLFGAHVTTWAIQYYQVDFGAGDWLAILLGAALAAALAMALLEEALMVLSSILGASLLVGTWELEPLQAVGLFAVALIAGIAIQSRAKSKSKKDS